MEPISAEPGRGHIYGRHGCKEPIAALLSSQGEFSHPGDALGLSSAAGPDVDAILRLRV